MSRSKEKALWRFSETTLENDTLFNSKLIPPAGRRYMSVIQFILVAGFCLISSAHAAPAKSPAKKRILVVSSYHREYLWTKETNEGFCAAMLKFGYFDNKAQVTEYTKNDYVETSRVIVKKLWMDSKRKEGKEEIAQVTVRITQIANEFKPNIIFLGDDNAARYIGNQFLDAEIPIVFWGVNNTPVKYGLVDNKHKPGHNVTGIYQSGYYAESLALLKKIVPGIKTFAVLTDDTSTGRSHLKKIEYLVHQGIIPLKLVASVATNDFEMWKNTALKLQQKVDAFFIAQYSSLKDEKDNYVPTEKVASWYLSYIKIPEAAVQGQFVKQGMLCSADDSGYNQGYEAMVIAHDILANGANPATYPPRAPERGPFMVNKKRAKMLGITLTNEMGIEGYVE